MEQEQRIKSLENEVTLLKEEIKKNRKANVWKKVKDKYSKELDSFNWTHIHKMIGCDGKEIVYKKEMFENYHISQAIGTLVRATLKRKGLNYLEETDSQKAEDITRQILEIMQKERR